MQNGKELWISQIYFPMENLVDRVHNAWIGQPEQKGAAAPCQCAGAMAHRCSLAEVEEDEPDEVVPEGCSQEHERRR
jgi:hypothetical protein